MCNSAAGTKHITMLDRAPSASGRVCFVQRPDTELGQTSNSVLLCNRYRHIVACLFVLPDRHERFGYLIIASGHVEESICPA